MTLEHVGAGTGQVAVVANGVSIPCTANCAVVAVSSLSFTATADPGMVLAGWGSDGATCTGDTCVVAPTAQRINNGAATWTLRRPAGPGGVWQNDTAFGVAASPDGHVAVVGSFQLGAHAYAWIQTFAP